MTVDQLLEALRLGEDFELEFKSGRGGVPGSLWESYSSFANTDGGVIVLGVRQRASNRFEIQGLDDAEKMRQNIWNCVNNRDHVSHNLLGNDDLRVEQVGDKDVIVIEVPRADRRQRPVFLGRNPITGTYRRYHEGDYHCGEDEVRRMLADSDQRSADSRVLPKFTIEDVHTESLQAYRNRFRSRDALHPWLELDVQEFLQKTGGYRRDRESGDEGLTVAGLLMFGREEAISDPASGISFQLDYRDRRSDDPSVRWVDRIWQDGKWNANLFQFFFRAYPRVTDGLKIPFGYQNNEDSELGSPSITRRDDTLVHEAIREAMVNCLVHADYRCPGGIVMEHRFDCLHFSNPGTLLVSFEQLVRGGVSQCRNETLQKMFSLIGLGEKAGSGIDKIREGWKSVRWRIPTLGEQQKPDRVTVVMPMVSLLPKEAVEKLRKILGDELETLSADEVQALVTADMEGAVSNFRLQSLTEQHPADLTKLLKGLVARDLIEREGHGRGATYRWSERLRSPDTTPDRTPDTAPDTAPDTESKLLEIALPAREQLNLPAEELRSIIQRLCEGRYLTSKRLGELLKRNAEGLQRRHLGPLARGGELALRFPDERNHPDQAYTSAGPSQ